MQPILFHLDSTKDGTPYKRQVVVFPNRQIGKEGGYGKVFEACYADNRNERLAVKVLKPELYNNPIARERFRREGVFFRFIRHPHLVETEGYAEDGGRCYVVTRFIQGQTLQQIFDDNRNLFTEQQIVSQYIVPLLNVLSFLHHEHRVIHRDLKATNIIVESGSGNLRLIDLGIAKIHDLPSLTKPNQKGPLTEQYAPPEMINNRYPPAPATDLYSLGILLYLMLTRRLPFEHTNAAALYEMILNKPLPYHNQINPEMWMILSKLTDKELPKRYQSVAEVWGDLFPPPKKASPWDSLLNLLKKKQKK